MLLAELIHLSIRPSVRPSSYLSLSSLYFLPSCPSSALVPVSLTHTAHQPSLSLGVIFPWLTVIDSVNETLKTQTHSVWPGCSDRSLGNSSQIQWGDSKCLRRWLSAIWSDLWCTKQDTCWAAQCVVCDSQIHNLRQITDHNNFNNKYKTSRCCASVFFSFSLFVCP